MEERQGKRGRFGVSGKYLEHSVQDIESIPWALNPSFQDAQRLASLCRSVRGEEVGA
jgi:hypothetical protein